MAFTEDLSPFFEDDDFAVAAVFSRGLTTIATTNVIFDIPTEMQNFEGTEVASDDPMCLAQTAAVAAVRRSDSVLIGGETYTVKSIKDDGTGVSRVNLELY